MLIRLRAEELERPNLAPLRLPQQQEQRQASSRTRMYCPTAFQRDRDRIIHP